MIVKSIQTGLVTGSLLLAGYGLVQAQPASSEVADESSDSGATEQADNRSPQVILSEAQTNLDRIEAAADNIGRMLRSAREDKDIVKALCLDDKLNQINVAARTASDRVAGLEAAVKSNNEQRIKTEDAVLAALFTRGNELVVEANQCIGAEQGALGETKLEITVDPSLPEGDTSSAPPSVIVSAPPVAVSPTL